DLPVLLVGRRAVPGLDLVHAVPLLDDETPFVGLAFDCRNLRASCRSSNGNQAAAGIPDDSLRFRRVFFSVTVFIADIDQADEIDRRLRLRVQPCMAAAPRPIPASAVNAIMLRVFIKSRLPWLINRRILALNIGSGKP